MTESKTNFQKLIEYFSAFPGIGTRQAKRFIFHLLLKDQAYIDEFTSLLTQVRKETKQCELCMRHHSEPATQCLICSNQNRKKNIILIIEKDQDIESFEHAHVYDGLYFVMGGLISIISKDQTKNIRIEKLYKRIEKNDGQLDEIILAFPMTPNGTFTDSYIRQEVSKKFKDIQIKSLGRGFSTGSDPEYADTDTLSFAIKNRV